MKNKDNTSVVTTAVVALAATGAILMYVQNRRRKSKHEDSDVPCNVPRSGNRWWWTTSRQEGPSIPPLLMKSPYARELQVCVNLAQKAGQNMKGYLNSKGTQDEHQFDVGIMSTKTNEADFCTKIDIENERLIIQGFYDAFPDYAIIGEESVGTGEIPPLDPSIPTFIIDPIDGTTNFAQGLFMTCVSIGLCVGGSPVLGVVYAPATDEWYLAVSGYGAYRNGIPLSITQDTRKTSLSQAVICCEFGYSRQSKEIEAMVGGVSRILEHGCRAIRQLGSGVLDLCYVATGRLDVVYAGIVNEGWKPWDYAAGYVICQEAGCIMENLRDHTPGKGFDLYGKSVICGVSREIVDSLRHVLLS